MTLISRLKTAHIRYCRCEAWDVENDHMSFDNVYVMFKAAYADLHFHAVTQVFSSLYIPYIACI